MLMKSLVWIGLGSIAVGFSGFGPAPKITAPATAPVKSFAWPGVSYRPVTAYEFARAHGQEVLVINDGVCDWETTLALIEKYKIAEKEISVEKGREIFEATTYGAPRPLVAPPLPSHRSGIGAGGGVNFTTILCYVPHHILIFRDDSGLPVKALEICITCEKWRASSTIEKSERGKMDVPKLKTAFGELGLLHPSEYDKPSADKDAAAEPVSTESPFGPGK